MSAVATMSGTEQMRLIDVNQVSERTGLSTKTVRKLIASGALPAVRIGKRVIRISENALSKVMEPVHPAYTVDQAMGVRL